MESPLANTAANLTDKKHSFLHRSSVPAGYSASSVRVFEDPSAAEADVVMGFQFPLNMSDAISRKVASTMAPGALAFKQFGPWQQVQEPGSLSNSTVPAESYTSLLPPRTVAIDDNLPAWLFLQHYLAYLGSFEVLAGIACFCGVCWLVHRFVLRRPRMCLAVVGTWSFLFLLDLLVGRGPTACVKHISNQMNEASQASRELARVTVRFVAAWLSVLMPVLVDVAMVLAKTWQQLTPRQRLFTCSSVVVLYAVLTTVRAIRKHSRAISKIIFQASFLLAGPILWLLSGQLSTQGLEWTVSGVMSGLPTLMSFHAACRGLVKQDARIAWSCGRLGIGFWTQEEWCEMWISFWASWPILLLLRFATQRLPQLSPDYQHEFLLPSELERALIVFTLWIQFWQGGLLVNYTIRSMFCAEKGGILGGILAVPAALTNRVTSTLRLMPRMNTIVDFGSAVFQNRTMGSALQMLVVLVVVGFVVITWMFYHAFRLACDVMVLLAVCFAAVDSAHVVFKGSQDFYVKRLSFWVLLQIWRTLSKLPVIGSGLSLTTPIAFSLFFIAGDHILAWLLIPLAARLESLPQFLGTTLASLVCPWAKRREDQKLLSLSPKGESDAKKETLEQRASMHKTDWHFLERTFFHPFIAPVTELLSISNMKVFLALKALLADAKSAV